jgi:death-on-curing protein
MTQYLDLEDALLQVKSFGFYVKDPGLLESALARPRTTVFGQDAYETLALKAAAMMHSIIKNHPMIDGNKRTSWLLMVTFIWINGFEHNMTTEVGFDLTLGIAESRYSLEEAAAILERHLKVRQ